MKYGTDTSISIPSGHVPNTHPEPLEDSENSPLMTYLLLIESDQKIVGAESGVTPRVVEYEDRRSDFADMGEAH